jgi:hypothetical protein
MTYKAHKPAQNIDVHYYQTRKNGEWRARVSFNDETYNFGPANIATLVQVVGSMLRQEATYADACARHQMFLDYRCPRNSNHEQNKMRATQR